jgi:hypothetical protein
MEWQSQLIDIYLTACEFFSQLSPYIFLKIGPNSSPSFSDAEAITIYIFGIMQNLRNKKAIHKHFKNYLLEWFPNLPEYEGFVARINKLDKVLVYFIPYILRDEKFHAIKNNPEKITVVDSMPIVLANGYRAHKCNTGKDFATIGYCSSKKMYYHGVKLHLLSEYQNTTLPVPKILKVTAANVHDFTAMKEHFYEIKNSKILGDKAYCDKATKENLLKDGIELHTPIKFSKNKKIHSEDEKLYSKIVSSFRQSIEIYFGWLIEKSDIQNASKVRSTKGLFVHVFGRFSACLFQYKFSF